MADEIGKWLYLSGLAIAVVLGLWPNFLGAFGVIALALLGAGVGYLNISKGESVRALVAVLALTVTSAALNAVTSLSAMIGPILLNLVAFAGAAGFVVAVLTFFDVAKKN